MFLKSKWFIYPAYINISKRFISKEVQEVLNTRLEPPIGTIGNQVQLAFVSKHLNAINIDLFVNSLNQSEDRQSVILDLLANLRATKLANTCLESTHFAVVRHLVENSSMQDVVPILLNRQKYGIFLNDFMGFVVTQILHDEGEYVLGLELALKLILLDELDIVFIQAFCLKSIIETLNKKSRGEPADNEKANDRPKEKIQEKKVRVKFIRNNFEIDQHKEMGKAFLKIAPKILEGGAKDSAMILGFVLTKNYVELQRILDSNANEINADIAGICKEFLSREDKTDFITKIGKKVTKELFVECIDYILKKAAVEEATTLVEKQKQLLIIWQQLREQEKLAFEKEISEKERIENIKRMNDEISIKKELLWFFDNEDKFDLEIYNKRVYYPKRWFGKKKKPRVVDEHYVPPQIRRIN